MTVHPVTFLVAPCQKSITRRHRSMFWVEDEGLYCFWIRGCAQLGVVKGCQRCGRHLLPEAEGFSG